MSFYYHSVGILYKEESTVFVVLITIIPITHTPSEGFGIGHPEPYSNTKRNIKKEETPDHCMLYSDY